MYSTSSYFIDIVKTVVPFCNHPSRSITLLLGDYPNLFVLEPITPLKVRNMVVSLQDKWCDK